MAACKQGAPTQQLAIKALFDPLSAQEKLYAHHLAKAAWAGGRIILRQTSPEGTGILDLILDLHAACDEQWNKFVDRHGLTQEELWEFLDFAGFFLSGLGNYCGEGDQKIVPQLSADALRKMASCSRVGVLPHEATIEALLSTSPSSLGFDDENNQSNYYTGKDATTREEIATVARVMQTHGIEPENTRIHKVSRDEHTAYHIVQASSRINTASVLDGDEATSFILESGDHAAEMSKICQHLSEAAKYVSNEKQADILAGYIECFTTGSLEAYRKAQRAWVTDVSPRIETIFGFVEPYRDPYGVRGEWESAVCISDPYETNKLQALVDSSAKFIRMLPWAVPGNNDGKGPIEATLFKAPDFTIVHSLAFCSSFIWEAVNLPNYSDIRETCGSKNIVFANRMNLNNDPSRPCHFIDQAEVQRFRECNHIIRFIVTAIHELLGHGTGKLLTEMTPGRFNFDRESLPTNPLTGRPIETWYKPGQTWTSVFEKLATSVEECRAMLVSYFLADNKEVLDIFGYNDNSEVTADDLIYFTFLHIGVEGLQALRSYNARDNIWGQAHARANFAILKHLLLDGEGVLTVTHDAEAKTVRVAVDRSKILSHGKPAIGRMLCRIHVWRCIADVESCRGFYEPLGVVDGEYEAWRRIVVGKPEPAWKFVQPNTALTPDGEVVLKVYEATNEGIIQSFVDREV